jgi:hypothetical protein
MQANRDYSTMSARDSIASVRQAAIPQSAIFPSSTPLI